VSVAPATGASLLEAITARDQQLGSAVAVVSRPAETTPAGRFVLLSIAAGHYAISEASVTELERVPRITVVPHTPPWMRGVTNVRGDIVSVIDMRTFLHLDSKNLPSARLLVVRLLDQPFITGLLVDAVDRIVAVPADAIKAPASPLEGPLAPYISGVCELGDRLVAVLDIERFLQSGEIRQFDDPKEQEDHHA
jgi:purine-binding chemotaxis protein CheW